MRLTNPAQSRRGEIDAILASEGFLPCEGDVPGVAYFQLGRWLVRPEALHHFLLRKTLFTGRRLVGPRVARFRRGHGAEKYPILLLREEGRPKASFFDLSGGRKKAVWIYSEDFRRELEGARHFSREPSRVAPLLSADESRNSVTQQLVGGFFGHCAPLPSLIEFMIRVYAKLRGRDRSPLDYTGFWRSFPPGRDAFFNTLLEKVLPALEYLESLAGRGELGSIAAGLTHGDLSTHNGLLGPGSEIHLIDFDLADERALSFDFVYLHVTEMGLGRRELVDALRRLQRAGGEDCLFGDDELYLYAMSLFVLELGMEVWNRYLSVPEIDKFPRGRNVHLASAIDMLRKALPTHKTARRK